MKQRIPSLDKFINESKNNKDDREIYPEWVTKNMFGAPIKNANELKKGSFYVVYEPGMNAWQADMTYDGIKSGKHVFASDGGIDLTFSQKELEDYMAAEDILKQLV